MWHGVSAVCTRDINLWFFIFQGSLCYEIMAFKTSPHTCFPLFNIWIILYYMEFIQLSSVLHDKTDGMSCQFWRDLKRTGPNLRELVLDNLFRDEASEMRVKCVCLTGSVSLRVTRLKTIRCRWLDVWTLWQSRRISSEALQPETNTSTLLRAEQTRSLQQAGQQYTICWLGNGFNRSGPEKSQTEDLPYCSYRAVGHCSSFNFVQMLKTVCWHWNQPMWTCTVTQIRGPHIQNRHYGFSQKSTDVPGVSFYAHSLVPPLRSGLSRAASLRVCCHCQIRMVLE